MSDLSIDTDDGRAAFTPGEVLRGRISWRLDDSPRRMSLRLFWHTSGRGTTDVRVVDEIVLSNAAAAGSERFALQLPSGPYSFSGRLISLIWSLELLVDPGGHVERRDLVVSSTGKEVLIDHGGGGD